MAPANTEQHSAGIVTVPPQPVTAATGNLTGSSEKVQYSASPTPPGATARLLLTPVRSTLVSFNVRAAPAQDYPGCINGLGDFRSPTPAPCALRTIGQGESIRTGKAADLSAPVTQNILYRLQFLSSIPSDTLVVRVSFSIFGLLHFDPSFSAVSRTHISCSGDRTRDASAPTCRALPRPKRLRCAGNRTQNPKTYPTERRGHEGDNPRLGARTQVQRAQDTGSGRRRTTATRRNNQATGRPEIC